MCQLLPVGNYIDCDLTHVYPNIRMNTFCFSCDDIDEPDIIFRHNEEIALLAKNDISGAKILLLGRFEPLCVKCARQARIILPYEEYTILMCAVQFEFLILLDEFEPHRGVPFGGYITAMLPRRVSDWAQKERRYQGRQDNLDDILEQEVSRSRLCCACNIGRLGYEEVESLLWWKQELRKLKPRQRRVMELILQGFSEREIAVFLKLAQPTINELKRKAQKHLQKKWQENL